MSLGKKLISTDAAGGIDGTANFAPVIYTGTGGVQSISSLSFAPDMVWIKKRSSATSSDHSIQDTIRGFSNGGSRILYPNLNLAETTNADANYFRSFDSNGFTLGGNTYYNGSSETYVAWCWKGAASTTTIASGTNGSNVISNVRANTDGGFSIVKFGALGAANSIVSHGLSSPPELIIYKNLDTADNWYLYTSATGLGKYLNLNTNGAVVTNASNGFTSVNSNTFTVNLTTNADDTVAYCFHSVAGYQSIGSYNGSSSAVTVTTGFNPRWVLIKRSNLTNKDWVMFDQARSGGNDMNDFLVANTAAAEFVNAGDTKINGLSNGFSVNAGMWDGVNASGGEYFYWAIA